MYIWDEEGALTTDPTQNLGIGHSPQLTKRPFINMNHLEQFKVAFVGAKSRQVVDNGVAKKYYRNAFILNGKTYFVSDAEDLSGKAGIVQFVKAGEDNASGGKVAQDAFSLMFATTLGATSSAKAVLAEI